MGGEVVGGWQGVRRGQCGGAAGGREEVVDDRGQQALLTEGQNNLSLLDCPAGIRR